MRKIVFVFLFLFVLTACGDSKDGVTTKDLAIQKVNDSKAVVQYGMSRTEAEEVLGKGEDKGIANAVNYDSGVSIMYREDKVAGITLGKESKDAYETAGGFKIGMSKDDFKQVYGDQYLKDMESNLDYAYDSRNKRYLQEKEWAAKSEDDTKIYVISAMFDGKGVANGIVLVDKRMTMTFR
ncbi:lipoprotein [Paenibacillus sp. FSL K6-1096]|uniref:lipoprotein n=1 Tax=Paenibacillus sp. FSL K6-1096 TaxID=2921460 RepID=UPI0030EDF632